MSTGDFRGQSNLVLFLAHSATCAHCEEKLRELNLAVHKLREEGAELLVVVPGSSAEVQQLKRQLALSIPVLVATGGTLGEDATIIVTDRFGEIFFIASAGARHALPTATQLVAELAFVELQCPE